MADYTDLELAKMEKEIEQIYIKAQKEIQDKWDKYMAKAQPKVDKAQAAYIQAMASGNPTKAAKAKEAYEKAALNMTLQNAHYQEMVNQVTQKISEANEIALTYLNGQMPKVYCHSYNEFENQNVPGYSFELVNEDAVKHLITSGNKSLLPQKKLNPIKDKAWNMKNINSQVLQGILQGESMDEISKRIFPIIHDPAITDKGIIHKNEVSAIRAARTMVTGAENKGRQDSFIRAANDGVKMKRIWVAAHDSHTRDSHLDLHGQEVGVDEPFQSEHGEIMYPGDPEADPREVYNCRCAIRVKVLGFDWSKQSQAAYTSAYAGQYQGTGVTAQYYSMLDEDKALGNAFWKALNAEGKPSAVWKDYLAGNTTKEVTKKLDDILAKYKGTGQPVKPGAAKKAASVAVQKAPKPDLGMYQDKSMTATFYSVKAENKELGKDFWDILQAEANPSNTWKEYLIGIAPKDITDKLDKVLLQHKGTGAWTKPVSAKKLVFKETFKDLDDINDIVDFNIWNEVQKAAVHEGTNINDFWKAYKAGKIKNADLDKIFKEETAKTTKKAASNFKANLPEKLGNLDNDTMMEVVHILDDKGIVGIKAPVKYYNDWITGKVKDVDLDDYFMQKAGQSTAKKAATKMTIKEAVEESEDLVKAKAQLAVAQGNLDSIKNKTYTGIWKDPVSLSDYEAKAATIAAKKQWYYDQIEDLTHKIDAGDIAESVANAKIAQYEKYIDDLIEFESQGKLYATYAAEYKKATAEVKKLTPIGDTFGPEAYTQARKDNAIWAKSNKQADDVLRGTSGEVWRNAKSTERGAIYEYTKSYHKFNEPLRGYEYGTGNFVGVGKTDLNASYANNGKRLNAMTDIIEKSKLPQDQWFQRGCGYDGMEKFFQCSQDLLRYGTQEELEKELLGKTVTEYGFMSMGSAKGQGFSGNILINIYAPQGTKAMYVEPFSYYGKGVTSGKWDGISSQGSFGSELETILQQNTDFRITKIERTSGTLYFDIEVIAQNEPQRWVK